MYSQTDPSQPGEVSRRWTSHDSGLFERASPYSSAIRPFSIGRFGELRTTRGSNFPQIAIIPATTGPRCRPTPPCPHDPQGRRIPKGEGERILTGKALSSRKRGRRRGVSSPDPSRVQTVATREKVDPSVNVLVAVTFSSPTAGSASSATRRIKAAVTLGARSFPVAAGRPPPAPGGPSRVRP